MQVTTRQLINTIQKNKPAILRQLARAMRDTSHLKKVERVTF
jgi:hypothetical protein